MTAPYRGLDLRDEEQLAYAVSEVLSGVVGAVNSIPARFADRLARGGSGSKERPPALLDLIESQDRASGACRLLMAESGEFVHREPIFREAEKDRPLLLSAADRRHRRLFDFPHEKFAKHCAIHGDALTGFNFSLRVNRDFRWWPDERNGFTALNVSPAAALAEVALHAADRLIEMPLADIASPLSLARYLADVRRDARVALFRLGQGEFSKNPAPLAVAFDNNEGCAR